MSDLTANKRMRWPWDERNFKYCTRGRVQYEELVGLNLQVA